MRYFLRLSFNGKNYNGWQVQDNAPTVQKALNEALSIILKQEITTTGCGRTDTGVHASEFYAHFDLNETIALSSQPPASDKFPVFSFQLPTSNCLTTYDLRLTTIYKLNGILPIDIAIHNIFPVKDDAHSRFSAILRTYKYNINQAKDPFNHETCYHVSSKLDVPLMNEAAKILMEYSDFSSFAKLHSYTKTNNCKISHADWTINNSPLERLPSREGSGVCNSRGVLPDSQLPTPNSQLVFTITSDRFLRNMVRAIVGTLLDIGKGKISLKEFREIIESKNRSDAGYSVPAHALFLTKVDYPEDIFII